MHVLTTPNFQSWCDRAIFFHRNTVPTLQSSSEMYFAIEFLGGFELILNLDCVKLILGQVTSANFFFFHALPCQSVSSELHSILRYNHVTQT